MAITADATRWLGKAHTQTSDNDRLQKCKTNLNLTRNPAIDYNYMLLAVFLKSNVMENLLSKEELKNQLKIIAEAEEKEMIEKNYPEFKKLEGKCFKNKNNYSCPEKPSDYWWLYTKITEISPDDVYDTRGNGVTCHYKGYSFQTDKDGNVSTQKIDYGYVHSLDKEISKKEFDKAFENMISALNELSR